MKILGISAFYHDSAAALVEDGEIICAAQEERFTRKKHDPSFPINAIKFCLEYSGREINELDAIVFYDKPLLKFERLLETYFSFAPKGLRQFLSAAPVWIKEKLFLKKLILDELKKLSTRKEGRKEGISLKSSFPNTTSPMRQALSTHLPLKKRLSSP